VTRKGRVQIFERGCGRNPVVPETCTKHDADLQVASRTTVPLLGARARYRYRAGCRGEHGVGEPGESCVTGPLDDRARTSKSLDVQAIAPKVGSQRKGERWRDR
jgi:hypothetical protein